MKAFLFPGWMTKEPGLPLEGGRGISCYVILPLPRLPLLLAFPHIHAFA